MQNTKMTWKILSNSKKEVISTIQAMKSESDAYDENFETLM